MKTILAIIALALAGCASLPPEDGPDTKKIYDSEGNPNFGPK